MHFLLRVFYADAFFFIICSVWIVQVCDILTLNLCYAHAGKKNRITLIPPCPAAHIDLSFPLPLLSYCLPSSHSATGNIENTQYFLVYGSMWPHQCLVIGLESACVI